MTKTGWLEEKESKGGKVVSTNGLSLVEEDVENKGKLDGSLYKITGVERGKTEVELELEINNSIVKQHNKI